MLYHHDNPFPGDMTSGASKDAAGGVRRQYHREVEKYRAVYGERTTVVVQQGSMYNLFDEQAEMAHRLIGLAYNAQHSAGFPKHKLDKWCQMLTDLGYVVVVMDQRTVKRKNGCEEIERETTQVFGPGTPIDLPYDCDSAVCAVVYLDNRPGVMGYATFESNTGRTQAGEFVETDFEAAFGGVLSAALADSPAHTAVVYSDDPDGEDAVARFQDRVGGLRAFGKRVDHLAVDPVTLRDSHIRETIRRQFDDCGLMTAAADTYAGLGGRRYAARAFAHLVHFVFRKDDAKLRIMEQPTAISLNSHMDVPTSGLRQLDILGDDGLLRHLPRPCTGPGRRALRHRLCRPSRDPEEIERRLCVADSAAPHHAELRALLSGVKDLEGLHRDMRDPGRFPPPRLVSLVDSLRVLKEASGLVAPSRRERHPGDAVVSAVEAVVDVEATRYAQAAVFREGVSEGLDRARRRRDALDSELAELVGHLNLCSGAIGDDHFKAEETCDGLRIAVTSRRFAAAMKEARRRRRSFEVGGRVVPCHELGSSAHGNRKAEVLATHAELGPALADVAEARGLVRDLTEALYREHLARIHAETSDCAFVCARELEDLDVAAVSAACAERRGFVRPTVVSGRGAFVRATDLRNPIVEALDGPHPYVGNDLDLGESRRGLLLYGINGSGKSCLMKSVGIAVCMAQAGMYVAADALSIGPFSRLFTRIWNNDDVNRGLSTFKVEATELNQILRNGDSMTLVLGDELCSGTERLSATAIITAGIEVLHENRCRFVLATHQHDVADMVSQPEIDIKHLHVSTDRDGCLVYERKLRDGVGARTYGVTVCRSLGMPDRFLERADGVMRRLQGIDPAYALSAKRSNYNSGVYMGACERCRRRPAAHTHHRDPQATAAVRVKNAAHNLEALCAECHDAHHKLEREGRLAPTKRVQTSSGVKEVLVDIA